MSCHDLAERALLRRGGMKGQHFANGFTDFVVGRERNSGALAHAAAFQLQAQLEEEQFFKDEAAMCRCRPGLQLRQRSSFRGKVHLTQRGFAVRQIESTDHRRGQALRYVAAHAVQQVEDHLALPAGCQTRAAQRLVHRRDSADFQQASLGIIARVRQNLELRLDHLEVAGGARRLDLSVESHRLPGMELAVEITGVKPDALEGVPALPHGEFEERHAAGAQQRGAANLRDHAGCFAGLQFVETARILAVFVAKGKMVKQVLGSLNALGGEHLRYMRTYAAHKFDWTVEAGHIQDANASGACPYHVAITAQSLKASRFSRIPRSRVEPYGLPRPERATL